MFCLKIVESFEGYKKGPFKRNFPEHGILYSFSETYSFNKINLSIFSAKKNFLWMKSSETYASYYIIMDIGSVSGIALY